MTDPIADMFTRIRNAQMVAQKEVSVPYSKMKHRLADILIAHGYILAVKQEEVYGHQELMMTLKYFGKIPAIHSIRRVSKPGKRVYVGANKLPYVYDKLGVAIISTSKGLMTNNEARKQKIGGEVICEIF
ncbi:MAG TPA: 30S ribosomal protein S8 [Patescibacteria group bacterium]|nr:30S ribosomal protein S8 [Patescibacteria group bacterium]